MAGILYVSMFFGPVIVEYFWWHYTTAPGQFVRHTRTGVNFLWHYFSIPILIFTLFAPFKRIVETPGRRFSFEDWFGRIVINLLSRIIGACIRICVITGGILATLVFIVCSFISFAVWLAAPLLIPFCIIYGVALIISAI